MPFVMDRLILCLLLASASLVNFIPGVTSYYTINDSNTGYSYAVFENSQDDTKSWYDARKKCRQIVSLTSDLAEIMYDDDVAVVNNLLSSSGASNAAYWLGIHESIDAPSTFMSIQLGQTVTFDKWDSGRPKTDLETRCGTVKLNDKWRDEKCIETGPKKTGVLCRSPLNVQPFDIDPHTGCPPTMIPFSNLCFDFHLLESGNFTTARRICEAIPGGRMIVPTVTTQDFVYFYTTLTGTLLPFWIGITDEVADGDFQSIYGEALVAPVPWSPIGAFSRASTSMTDCAAMSSTSGSWYVDQCDQINGIMCAIDPLQYQGDTTTATPPSTTDAMQSTPESTPEQSASSSTTDTVSSAAPQTSSVTTAQPTTLQAITFAATTVEATTSEATTFEATTSEATTSEATTSEATTSTATTSEATTKSPTTSPDTTTMMETTLEPQMTTVYPSTDFSTDQSTVQSTEQSNDQPIVQSTVPGTSFTTSGGMLTAAAPTLCSLADVEDFQTALACSNASHINVSQGKLPDTEKETLKDFLKLVASLPADEQLTFPETDAIAELVLEVFSKLTDQNQSLSIEEEMEILAETEEAMKLVAGTLRPRTCTSVEHGPSSANLCHSSSLGVLDGYKYTYVLGYEPDETGTSTRFFEENLEFDLSNEDPNADEEVKLVILRKERAVESRDTIYYLPNPVNDSQVSNMTWIELNSAVLTFSLYVQDIRKSVPVVFSLFHQSDIDDDSLKNGTVTVNTTRHSICAFWDDEHANTSNHWSSRGCEVIPDKSAKFFSLCSCNHTTNFAVLMQVKSYQISSIDSLALTWITYIGCSTSMVMLVLTLTVFFYLGTMLRSDRVFIHTNLSIAILLAQILFIAGIDRTENLIVCKIVALSLHFSYLSVFGWMMVEGVHLYMKVVKVYGSENIKMYPYLLIGWGIPAIITLVSFGASNDGYGTGTSCWLDISSGLIWAFVAPALVVITINMIVLLLVVRIIIKSAHLNKDKHYDHIKAGIKGAIVLLPILGLTWVFGLLAVNSATVVFQYLFTIFNSFQGLFIFLIHCVFNSEVKSALKRKSEKRQLNREKNTMENSMTFTYSSKKSSNEQSTCDTDRHHVEGTDTTSLSSGLSSRPGSGTSSLFFTPSNKPKRRPHSGAVSPMPITEADDESLLNI